MLSVQSLGENLGILLFQVVEFLIFLIYLALILVIMAVNLIIILMRFQGLQMKRELGFPKEESYFFVERIVIISMIDSEVLLNQKLLLKYFNQKLDFLYAIFISFFYFFPVYIFKKCFDIVCSICSVVQHECMF